MTSPATIHDTAARPLNLPQFTLILGRKGDNYALAEALAAPNECANTTSLHQLLGESFGLAYLGLSTDVKSRPKYVAEGVSLEDFARDFDQYLCDILGDEYAAVAHINNMESGGLERTEDYIIYDATIADIQPFVDKYGRDSVLVINTGVLSSLADWRSLPGKIIDLVSEDPAERLAQLKRELGEWR